MLEKQKRRQRRHKHIRRKMSGTCEIPRLCIFRSNKHIYAQLIDDEKGKILVAANDKDLKKGTMNKKSKDENLIKQNKVCLAYRVGDLLAQKALEKKITKIVFDRGGYSYQGRVESLANAAREGKLKF